MGRFAELLAHAGVEEDLELRSTFGFMAFHGGNLEVGTDIAARAAADQAGASLYAVRQPPDLRWHIPSIEVTPNDSPALARFLQHVDVVVALHGFGREGFWTTLLLGGGHRPLATHLATHLRPALVGYRVVDDLVEIPVDLRGVHRNNPVNLTRGGGVQIELPPRVRAHGPFWANLGVGEPIPHTADLVAGLVAAATTWPPTPTG